MAGATSRLNGAKSRGPRTATGKSRSSRNATRHGLRSRTLSPARQDRALRMAQALMLSMDFGATTEGAAGGVYAASLAFSEADQQVEHIMALKEVVAAGTRAAIDAELAMATAWRDVISASMAFVESHATPQDLDVDVTLMMRAAIADSLGSASLAAKAKASGRWHVLPVDAGPWMGLPQRVPRPDEGRVAAPQASDPRVAGDPGPLGRDPGAADPQAGGHDLQAGSREAQAAISHADTCAFAVACARDLARLDDYLARAMARRRRAWRVLRKWGGASVVPAFGLAWPRAEDGGETRVSIGGRRVRLVRHDVLREDRETMRSRLLPRPSRASARRKAAPALNSLGQVHDHVHGLHLAVYWRYDDLGEPIGRLLAAAQAAFVLNHLRMTGHFVEAATEMQRRRDGFLQDATAALRLEGLDKVLQHHRNLAERDRLLASTLELFRTRRGPTQQPGGAADPSSTVSDFSGTNEPGVRSRSAPARVASGASTKGGAEPPSRGSIEAGDAGRSPRADDEAPLGSAPARRSSRAIEPGVSPPREAVHAPPTAGAQPSGRSVTAPAAPKTAMDIPLHASTHPVPTHPVPTRPGSTPPGQAAGPQPPPPPTAKPHPWDGIVPPERRGAGTMSDPLFRPGPLQFVTQSLFVLPGNPTISGAARLPFRQNPSSGSPQFDDSDDDEYEWVPKGEERLGMMRVKRTKPASASGSGDGSASAKRLFPVDESRNLQPGETYIEWRLRVLKPTD
jgi:hypothetical protein